jgi:hypothetical protein
MTAKRPRELIEGRPVLLVIDVQKGRFMPPPTYREVWMPGYSERMRNVRR